PLRTTAVSEPMKCALTTAPTCSTPMPNLALSTGNSGPQREIRLPSARKETAATSTVRLRLVGDGRCGASVTVRRYRAGGAGPWQHGCGKSQTVPVYSCLVDDGVSQAISELTDLRRRFLEYFVERGHLAYPSASLKSDDPTLMFTSAGMVQFKPYFLGATPKFAGYDGVWHRVTTAQKCLRINDIENVGRTLRHHSF